MTGRRPPWPPVRHRPAVLAAIAAGGALGAPSRYGLGQVLATPPDAFPVGTFTINITGSFVLGVLLTVLMERFPPTRYARPFLATGFLGAYTTFSTFVVEADTLVAHGEVVVAMAYVTGSVVAGLAAARLGMLVGRLVPHRPIRQEDPQ